jgi:homoprotocatechuate degradation regulator HpaR
VETTERTDLDDEILNLKFVRGSLAIACTRGREAVVSRFRPMLHRAQLSEQQWRVLRVLDDLGPQSAAEICLQCCIHKVSMSRILRTLETRGLIERTPSLTDARAVVVRLSDEGRSFLDPLLEEARTVHRGIARDFGKERYFELLRLLDELATINRGRS